MKGSFEDMVVGTYFPKHYSSELSILDVSSFMREIADFSSIAAFYSPKIAIKSFWVGVVVSLSLHTPVCQCLHTYWFQYEINFHISYEDCDKLDEL